MLRAAHAWVRSRRNHLHSRGRCLSSVERTWLSRFQDPALLARVRLYRKSLPLGPRIAAITYDDVILLAPDTPEQGKSWDRLLFHELVHVVQYELLGIDVFVDQYLRGWMAAGWRYRAIPLEVEAYEIEAMFSADPGRPFDVRAEVARRLAR